MIAILRWNRKGYKFRVAEVGDGGLQPGIAYRLNEAGEFLVANGVTANA